MSEYFRPLVQTGPVRPNTAVALAGGACWFSHAERLSRNKPPEVIRANAVPEPWLRALGAPRQSIAGLAFDVPVLMGILNVTPDSFSDGGCYDNQDAALARAQEMVAQGADILDVGGESTRPGALEVAVDVEISRIVPVIEAVRRWQPVTISIDTRKSAVASAARAAGANLVNDVSGFTFDPTLAKLCRDLHLPVIVMHAQGVPQTMQKSPHYDDVVLDVYDFLKNQIADLVALGIPHGQIIADPGIGFGKALSHNVELINRLSVFHGLGVPVMLGASRKGFIRAIGQPEDANDRMPGSLAVGLAALAQGVQILRVHDVAATRQAVNLWQAVVYGEHIGT